MPTLSKIDLNGVVYDINNSLIVTVNWSTAKTSHSATEIKTALDNNKFVFLYLDSLGEQGGDPFAFLVPIAYADETEAQGAYTSCYMDSNTGEKVITTDTFCIDTSKNLTRYTVDATPENNDLLHYKGHVVNTNALPLLGQDNPEAVSSVHAVYSSEAITCPASKVSTNTIRNMLASNNMLYGIGTCWQMLGNTFDMNFQTLMSNNPDMILGAFPIVSSSDASSNTGTLAVHIDASEDFPVIISVGAINNQTCFYSSLMYDDNTIGTFTGEGEEITVTKPFWMGFQSTITTNGHFTVYSNVPSPIKFQVSPRLRTYNDLSYFLSDYSSIHTLRVDDLSRNYLENYVLFKANSNDTLSYYTGEAEAEENDVYTVGNTYEIYRCNSTPTWEYWSQGGSGGLDTVPINTILNYDGNTVPDGYVEVTDTNNSCSLGLTALNKEHATTSWNAVNIMSDFTQGFKKGSGISFDDNKIKIDSNATITWIDITLYMKWAIPYPSDPGNRGLYIYKNGVRITTEFNGTLASSTEWHCDTYELMTEVSPGDYFEIYIVRGGYSSSITTTIEHAYLKVNSLI